MNVTSSIYEKGLNRTLNIICFGVPVYSINEVLEQFLEMNLVEVTRKIEKLEKDRVFYLQRRKRIEDNLEMVRLCKKE